ncbi:hypothetical protein NP233_g11529 [Leucocoprinus birnbaumii]|uniref:Uncharacterized protein n=1 Tax=Leucocoprinus birnbaumii TaxID=56174 RepID=A0AAD5YQV2_9AGAR|nr:hypothetical protein NP233_g11529 [Leucocoprinus birnbaumii]
MEKRRPILEPDFAARSSTAGLDGIQAFNAPGAQPGSPLKSLLLTDPFTFGSGSNSIIPDGDINMPSADASPQPVKSDPSDPTGLNPTNPIMLDNTNEPVDLEAPTTDPSSNEHDTSTSD